MLRRSRFLPALAFMLLVVTAITLFTRTAPAATVKAAALPDTGTFAPVAKQWALRAELLAQVAARGVTPERVRLLIEAGRPDEAAQLANQLTGEDPAADVARGRAWLATQDFPHVALIAARLGRVHAPGESERALRYDWLFACDDEASVDSLTRGGAGTIELLAAGRVAYDRLDFARADSCFRGALAQAVGGDARARHERAGALTGIALVQQKRREWDASLASLQRALAEHSTPEALTVLSETFIRLGRTDEAIAAGRWAVRMAPYHDPAHYLLGNGYAPLSYTQLAAAYRRVFADAAGRKALAAADALLAAGKRTGARMAYAQVIAAHPGWADARVRLASLDFEDGRFAQARTGCFAALAACPDYGRAHAVLAKALEGQRFGVDVHRAGYEARFAAAALPVLPGIEKFVVNWKSLSPRHQKRVALSIAPWAAYLPVLIDGGATFYIKPMYLLLSECPDQQALRDQRISYDSRLWDDVRGCGGYHTVTGVEDVERTIFDRYNTVLHELTHQVHAVLPADDGRVIQEHYAHAKQRDDATHDGYLSRYAGGSVFEYFAEGANALYSPMRDEYDPREVVRERLDRIDPALRRLVAGFMARADVSGSYPIAWSAGGDDRVERGHVDEALPFYRRALGRDSTNETVLLSLSRAQLLANRAADAVATAQRAVAAHPGSGAARVAVADADWHTRSRPSLPLAALQAALPTVRAEDRYLAQLEIGRMAWADGDANLALAAYDSVLAYQSDNPDGMQGRAAALALAGRTDDAVAQYERAVRMRTGIAGLRCDYARDLLRAGRTAAARAQLDAARLLDERNPTAEALRAWAELADGRLETARARAGQAVAWGPWCDLARIVAGAVEQRAGNTTAAREAWAPVDRRLTGGASPEYVYRAEIASWEEVHVLPVAERVILESFRPR